MSFTVNASNLPVGHWIQFFHTHSHMPEELRYPVKVLERQEVWEHFPTYILQDENGKQLGFDPRFNDQPAIGTPEDLLKNRRNGTALPYGYTIHRLTATEEQVKEIALSRLKE